MGLLILDRFVRFAKDKNFKCFAQDHIEDNVLMRQQIKEMYRRKDKESSDDRRQLSKAISGFTTTAERLVDLLNKS